MPQYTYRARSGDGKEVKGTLRAQSEERARALLIGHGLQPLHLQSVEGGSLLKRNVLAGGVHTKDLILFSRQLSSMVRAGVPILQALQSLSKQVDKPTFKKLLQELSYDVEGGESLSSAMTKHPFTFSLFFLGIIRTGEASGRLSESLTIMADYLEENYSFTRKVRTALMYPIFVITVVIIVVALMFLFVMPQLVALFAEAEVELPLVTRILIAVTTTLQRYWYIFLLLIVALGVIIRSYLRTPEGQYNASTWVLRMPVVSSLFEKVYLARMTSILHTLFSSDVPVIESLELAEKSIGNKVYQKLLADTAKAIKDGASVSSVWEHEPFIPPMLTTMVGVGEKSGEIEKAFSEANAFFKRDVEEMLNSITVFLEPLLIIFLAIGVGFIVAGVLLPIYNLVLVF